MSREIKHPSKNQTYSPNRHRHAAISKKFGLQLSRLPNAEYTQGPKQLGQATSSASSSVSGIDAQATQDGGIQAEHTCRSVGELDPKAKQAILTYFLFTGHRRICIPVLMSVVAQRLGHPPIELTTYYIRRSGKKAQLPSANSKHFEKAVRSILATVEAGHPQADLHALQNDKEGK